ncbi:hypothetical protein [Haladaptatus cibarius]|uniref:hypothetical protein n=1 Tax=Haladaptatus cibarius TaxID=453847 RepID=UPI001185C19F|nr:hypothetical protein [Haladaptatus cibarius]
MTHLTKRLHLEFVHLLGGSSLNYGDAALYALDAAIGLCAGQLKQGADIAYDAARVLYELVDSGNRSATGTNLEYHSSHSGAAENESYARFRTHHDYYYDSEIKVRGVLDGANVGSNAVPVSFYVYFPNGVDAEKNGTSAYSTQSDELPVSYASHSPQELQQNGYQLLSNSTQIKVLETIPAHAANQIPRLERIGGGGAVHRVQYPNWAKVEANPTSIKKQ